VYSSKGLKSTN